jgi:hypothetical protein
MGGSLDRDLINLILLVLGGLIAGGGAVFWLVPALRNRRPARPAGAPAPQTTPPSDLPPGLAGALYNRADVYDVIATVLDLGQRGHLTVEETKPEPQGGGVAGREYIYSLVNDQVALPFERAVLDALFAGTRVTRLSEARRRVSDSLWPLYQAIDDELARRGYVRTVRTLAALDRRNGRLILGLWGLALAALAAIVFLRMWSMVGLWALAGGGALAGLIGLWAAVGLRRITPRGAAEAERWFAFKQYLTNLPPPDLQEVARRFDEYLPYAVALSADALLIEQFRRGRVRVRVPEWYMPLARTPVSGGVSPSRGRKKRRDKPGADAEDNTDFDIEPGGGRGDEANSPQRSLPAGVEELNRSLVGSVESFNRSLAGMITTASIAFAGTAAIGGGAANDSSVPAAAPSDPGPFSSGDVWSGGGDSAGGGGGEGSSDVF